MSRKCINTIGPQLIDLGCYIISVVSEACMSEIVKSSVKQEHKEPLGKE
jgi:hypothetical protein